MAVFPSKATTTRSASLAALKSAISAYEPALANWDSLAATRV